jgi:hypothetical protein
MTDIDAREGMLSQPLYTPNIEYTHSVVENSARPIPPDFAEKFKKYVAPAYPSEVISALKQDGYNPYLIGYSHKSSAELSKITSRLGTLIDQVAGPVKVAHEIGPQQLQWIKEFLAQEEASQKREGGQPSEEREGLQEYRSKLNSKHSEHIALWLLEHGVDVVSIEHPDVQKWIQEDKDAEVIDEEDSFSGRGVSRQPLYTAIKRDAHALTVMQTERPTIITSGAMHTLKFDMLLNRDGQRSDYILDAPFDWENIMQDWQSAHTSHSKSSV